MVDSSFITSTLVDLVKINSVNPALEEGGPGEMALAKYIHQVLLSLGWEASLESIIDNRVNVVGKRKGTSNGRSLILNAHMDTVGVQGMDNPFGAVIKDGKLFGRGAYDMKGSIAAMLGVAKAIADTAMKLQGDLYLTFVADEEYESIGTEALLKRYKADACIVTEPTDLKVCLGHRGFGVFEINTYGKVAHGGLHREGVDANMKMGKLLHELNTLSQSLNQRFHHLCGEASLHVPLISGGQSLFIYSDNCSIKVERRTLPGETLNQVKDEFQNIIDELAAQDNDFKADIKKLIWRNPYEVRKSSAIVETLCQNVPGPVDFVGHTWWEDSGLFGEAGIETVIMGPIGGGIHQPVEWVELDSVVELAEILSKTAQRYCQ